MRETERRRGALLFGFFLIVANFGWNYWFQSDLRLLDIGYFVFLCTALITAICWLFVAYKRVEGQGKYFWLLLLFANASSLIGVLFFFGKLLLSGQGPLYPGVSEFFWTLQRACYFAALLLKMYEQKNRYKMVRLFFDCLIVMTATTAISWHYVISPLVDAMHHINSWGLLVAYWSNLVLDMGVLFGVVSLFLASKEILPGKSLSLLSIGSLAQFVADMYFVHSVATNTFRTGDLLYPLWPMAYICTGLACFFMKERNERNEVVLNRLSQTPKLYTKVDWIRLTIPYLSVLFLSILMIVGIDDRDSIVFGSALCVLFMIVRQMIIIVENGALLQKLRLLTETLEAKVTERTEELRLKNGQILETLSTMEHMAYHDLLCGLPNRRLYEDRLGNAIARAKRNKGYVAVIFIDLDRFKNINDRLGYSFGDLVIKQVSERLSGYFNESDTISRLNSDQFAVILEDIKDPGEAAEAGQKILTGISKPYVLHGQKLHITASVGIAIFPNDGSEVDLLMKRADAAMYQAKEKGKNLCQFFDPKLDNQSQWEWENDLYKALERDEFIVHYQPRVCTGSMEIVGMEALIRWQRPGYGMIPPDQFIPLAEETGLIMQIGEWVLHTACKQNKAWQLSGLPSIRVAVNLSSMQFQQANLVSMIQRVLTETKLDPRYLELEITESLAMHDIEGVIKKLNMLKEMGIAISMDDFGTGYSSLRYLGKFPIDVIKIDRSFIQEIDRNVSQAAIVSAINALGRSLQVKVLAEGVEEESQLAFLRSIGIEEMQGYLYSPPVPPEVFEQLLAKVSVQHSK